MKKKNNPRVFLEHSRTRKQKKKETCDTRQLSSAVGRISRTLVGVSSFIHRGKTYTGFITGGKINERTGTV